MKEKLLNEAKDNIAAAVACLREIGDEYNSQIIQLEEITL